MKLSILVICILTTSLYLPAADIQPPASQSWFTPWINQAQAIASPYITTAQQYWHTYAQPKLIQWGQQATRTLTGLGTPADFFEYVRKDDPHLIIAIHNLCKRPQLANLWEYNPPVLLATWLLRKAYLKGSQTITNLTTSAEDRIIRLQEEQNRLALLAGAFYNVSASLPEGDPNKITKFQLAQAMWEQHDKIGKEIVSLEQQAAQAERQSWQSWARSYFR